MKLIGIVSLIAFSLFIMPVPADAGDRHHKRGGDAFAQALECHNGTCQAAQPAMAPIPITTEARASAAPVCANGSCSVPTNSTMGYSTGSCSDGSCSSGSCSNGGRRSKGKCR